jgi:hypothetical protein
MTDMRDQAERIVMHPARMLWSATGARAEPRVVPRPDIESMQDQANGLPKIHLAGRLVNDAEL